MTSTLMTSSFLCGRASGVTGYIRMVVRYICAGLVTQLEQRVVSCAEERDAVTGLLTVLTHRWKEATQEPAGVCGTGRGGGGR